MPDYTIRLLVENLPDQRIVEGILKQEIDEHHVHIDRGWDSSTVVSIAEFSLLEHPERPVAVIINTKTSEPAEIEDEFRGPVRRILSRAAPQGWHAAFAVPRLDEWAMADDRIRNEFERVEAQRGDNSYPDRAVRFAALVNQEPFDREALCQSCEEARELFKFIKQTFAATPPAATT